MSPEEIRAVVVSPEGTTTLLIRELAAQFAELNSNLFTMIDHLAAIRKTAEQVTDAYTGVLRIEKIGRL